ncbi:MAG: DUF4856 domain-containing protein [Rhodospirillaceae bacterium]|nr:DUF4856 domain-containing protein [Rhodospirillaceae bacterium]|tara:strand:- start:1640 stop:3088 length:1449 start_codon:yes stop_codon:yes gene_type:complete
MCKRNFLISSAISLTLCSGAAMADGHGDVYGKFPVTVKGYSGTKTSSTAYTGQIARHVLHDSLKKLAGKGSGTVDHGLKAKMLSYYATKDKGRAIIAPKTKGPFAVKQTAVDEISGGKNLTGKTYKGSIAGMPNGMTGQELVEFWIDKASRAKKGVDAANGYNYPQLISKFIMGAVSYNQAVDNYLDEKLRADKKPNDKPYKKGAPYTGKEHSWDEAFGYFGTPAHTLKLTPRNVYEIAKQGSKSKKPEDALRYADHNKDGVVDLKTEMTFGPAYYAAGFDAGSYGKANQTNYLHTITRAFLDGRKLITKANGEKLTDSQRSQLVGYAKIISTNWEQVLAEATFKYAGSVYNDMAKLQTIIEAKGDPSKALSKYIKHWGELKGFILALQTGKENLGETATKLNRMIGFGPLMPNLSQVVDIDSNGNYVRDQGGSWGEYMLHMAKIQKLLVDEFSIKAKNNAISGDIADLAKKLGAGNSAEND